jgi:uncharacterized protein DUF6896
MSEPLRITCHRVDEIPSLTRIRDLVSDDQHLVLRFPSALGVNDGVLIDGVLQQLAPQLPDDSVFFSGGSAGELWITILKVISVREVLENAELILAGARRFQAVAAERMTALARKLNLPLEAFADAFLRFQLKSDSGDLDAGWRYGFHGAECRFTNTRTGQVVEVLLGFYPEFGVLDPYFFSQFLSTTEGLELVAGLFKHPYHDAARALDILEQQGLLKQVTDPKYGRSGLVPAEL